MSVQRPRAVETVHTTPVGDELMVHVVGSEETHLLSPTTTAVWRRCDGATTSSQLESIFPDEEPALRPELVQLALDQLERAGLIEDGGRSSDTQRETRRRFLKRAAIAAVAVPTITTIVTATPAAASSPATCTDNDQCTPDVCINGTCAPQSSEGGDCDEDADCVTGHYCDGAPSGTCSAQEDAGAACSSNNHCKSDICDGDFCRHAVNDVCTAEEKHLCPSTTCCRGTSNSTTGTCRSPSDHQNCF